MQRLSRLPWPGNCGEPLIFQAGLWALQQPHKHSNSIFTLN